MDNYQRTFETYNRMAQVYQEKFMDLDLYNDTYDFFCELVNKKNASVFEIGCGPGNITKYLLAQRPDFRITGIDAAPNMVVLAKSNNPGAEFMVMDCRNIDTLHTRFDAIICGFCMPYLTREDCVKLINDCSSLLNENGVLYLSYIEGNYSQSGWETNSKGDDPLYIYYYDKDFITETLNQQGFERSKLFQKPYPGKQDKTSSHGIIIALKKNES